MLKTFLLTLAITLLLTLNSNAQSCPAGYDGPFVAEYIININTHPMGGTIEVTYCLKCNPVPAQGYAIHISELKVHSDALGGVDLPVDQNGNHAIPLRSIYELIIQLNRNYCELWSSVPPCGSNDSISFPNITYGGCYTKTLVDDNPLDPQQSWYYEPCDPWWLVQFCYAEVFVCLRYIEELDYWKTIYTWGEKEAAFQCEGDCFELCD